MLKREVRPKTRLLALAASASALALVGYAVAIAGPEQAADGNNSAGNRWDEQHINEMLDALDATESQRSAIQAEMAALAPVVQDMDQRRQRLRQAAHQLVQSETIDAAQLEQLRLDMVSRIDDQSRELVQRMTSIASILTTEQRAELGGLMKEHHGERAHEHSEHGKRRHHFGH